MFPPEWPTMSEARKLLTRANALLEEQPRSRKHQDRALALYRRALEFQDSRLIWRNVGIVHFNREEWGQAEAAFLRARDHYWLGLLYEWTGRLEKAWREIRRAEPSSEQARVQARIARQLGRAAEAIPALEAWDDVDARFELIHLYDRAGRYADAWRTAEEANAMKGQRDPEPFPALRAPIRPENRSESPIFIVGLPRSGTTLLERMLAQHPALTSRGESLFFEFIAGRLEAGERITNIGAAYLMNYDRRTVDKYPMNFRYLDLIRATFPDARVIDMRRDRDDTLISCWFRNFQGHLPWSYHWDDLNAAYDRYLEEMDGRDVFPLRYERLVNFPEKTLAEVLEFCGLEWNERCLRHNADPTFHMYAYEDVRRPVTNERIGRAANYREFLRTERELRALA